MSKTVILKKHEDHRIAAGHLWAFSNEIQTISGEPQAGDIVSVRNVAGHFLGKGFYNPHSLIAVRMMSRDEAEEIDFQFFHRKIEAANSLRKKIYPQSETFRLIHGESDFLPGLIVDKYNDYFSVQTFSSGMEKRLTLICDVLESMFHPKAIVERNEAPIRSLEGLEQRKGIVRGNLNGRITISEFDIKYSVDIVEGQKTGFFLDQRENRKALRRYSHGANVLDCFCNEGGFSLNAAFAKASSVVGVDISEPTVQRAAANAKMNELDRKVQFIADDAFHYLEQAVREGKKFDLINLDPPSFAKSKKTVVKAKRGYREIHDAAFRLLNPGGILATASCSHHITGETFLDIINRSATAAGRRITMLEWRGAAPDHPVLPAMPETRYLKFGIFHVE